MGRLGCGCRLWALEPEEQLQQQIPYGDDKQEKRRQGQRQPTLFDQAEKDGPPGLRMSSGCDYWETTTVPGRIWSGPRSLVLASVVESLRLTIFLFSSTGKVAT